MNYWTKFHKANCNWFKTRTGDIRYLWEMNKSKTRAWTETVHDSQIYLIRSSVQVAKLFCNQCLLFTGCKIVANLSYFITAHKRSLGQGSVFTPVCHSVRGGGGSASRGDWGLPPVGGESASREVGVCIQGEGDLHPRGGVCIQGGWADPPPLDTTGYGQRAGGTHPTGMHSCWANNYSL